MDKFMYYIPAVLILAVIIFFGFSLSFAEILPFWWFLDGLLFVSAFIMSKNKFWACIGGLIVGGYFIYLSTLESGQVINIERPAGIVFIVVYLFFGAYILIKQSKLKKVKKLK